MNRGALALLFVAASALDAQLVPNARWKTLRTEHFRVHFTPELEDQARRAAANAEHAWMQLSAELTPPRGTVDIVVADNVDFTNGYATTFPTNRIVIYAHPPVHDGGLRFYDDWNALVVTHELAHIFHLDRTRGWWRVAQRVFGRDLLWFPNAYLPAWIIEGLAVYEESRLTGGGRLRGTNHRMVARTSALGGRVPRLDEWSATTSRFPGGGSVYVYGSLLIEFLARTQGEEGVRRFVERTSAAPIPWLLNRQTRKSFGVTLEQAWRDWRDSLARGPTTEGIPLPDWREITPRSRYAFHPRWMDDSSLVYVGTTGREAIAARRVWLSGRSTRLGRRGSLDPNVPMPGGGVLYSQLEYVTPYVLRSDLWVQRDGREQRITYRQRLSFADARADGRIVAVQAIAGGSRLVLVTADGSRVTPLTTGSADEQWAEPRWSPDGTSIAAIRIVRGGVSEIAIVDTTGAAQRLLGERAVISGLSWRGSNAVVFTSDRSGTAQIYVASVPDDSSASRTTRISSVVTGLFSPDVSPDEQKLAAVHFRIDGYRVGVGKLAADSVVPSVADTVVGQAAQTFPAAALHSAPVTAYRPWRSLVPRYWRPVIDAVDQEVRVGALTSGSDIVGRHDYLAQLQRNLDRGEMTGFAMYRYAGFGMPLLDVAVFQEHELAGYVTDQNRDTVGTLRERTRVASLSAVLARPRSRTYSYLGLGAAVELGDYSTDPAPLLDQLNPDLSSTSHLRTGRVFGGWSNTQRPELSISRENGVAIDGSLRVRHRDGIPGRSHIALGVGRGYRGFDLGAWAHHVLAVRAAGGVADLQSSSGFSAGGTSGEALEILPGLSTSGGSQTFGVRGFAPSTLTGLRAVAVSAELRSPLFAPSRGYRLLPVFLDRTALNLFADGASAWCPEKPSRLPSCQNRGADRRAIISVGAEVMLDAAFQYDAPYRFRVGIAMPVARRELASNRVSGYFTLGSDF